MANKLKFLANTYPITPDKFLSADEESGLITTGTLDAGDNAGAFHLKTKGQLLSTTDIEIEIEDEGSSSADEHSSLGEVTVKYSNDGGSTYLGRIATTTHDGNGASQRTIISTGAAGTAVGQSQAVPLDTNGDGIEDTVVVAVANSTANTVTFYAPTGTSTHQLDGTHDTWTSQGSKSASGVNAERLGLAYASKKQRLCVCVAVGTSIYTMVSKDYGATWEDLRQLTSTGVATEGVAITTLLDKFFVIAYVHNNAGDQEIHVQYSKDGVRWAREETVIATGATDYGQPAIVQKDASSILCAYYKGGTGIEASEYNFDSRTWSATTDTLPTAATTGDYPSLVRAPNGDIYLYARYTGGTYRDLRLSVKDRNSTTYGSYSVVQSESLIHCDNPSASVIAGAVWLTYTNSNGVIRHVMTKYPTTWSTTNTCWTDQFSNYQCLDFTADIWFTFYGFDGRAGDTFTVNPEYLYAGSTIMQGAPNMGWRSTNTYTSELGIVYDVGSDYKAIGDTVALFGCNMPYVKVQSNDTNVWTSPTLDITVGFSTGLTGTVGSLSNSLILVTNTIMDAHNIKPHQLNGKMVQMTSGTANGRIYNIVTNDQSHSASSQAIFTDVDTLVADGVAVSNTFKILNKDAWAEFSTPAVRRYVRVAVPANTRSPDAYHKIGAMVYGVRTEVEKYPSIGSLDAILPGVHIKQGIGNKYSAYRAGEARKVISYRWSFIGDLDRQRIERFFENYDYSRYPMAILHTDGTPYFVRFGGADITYSQVPGESWAINELRFEGQT